MTRKELLEKMPQLDYSIYQAIKAGQKISVEEAVVKIVEYTNFKRDHGFPDQTDSIGFSSPDLTNWLKSIETKIDEIKVFLSADEQGKLTVVLWPYKDRRPATDDETKEDGILLDPYNIGSRQPIV